MVKTEASDFSDALPPYLPLSEDDIEELSEDEIDSRTRSYRSKIHSIMANWSSNLSQSEDKFNELRDLFYFACSSLRLRHSKIEIEAEKLIWTDMKKLLLLDEMECENRIKATESMISKVFDEIIMIRGIKDMVNADTQIPDGTRCWILKVLGSGNQPKKEDDECRYEWYPFDMIILQHILGMKETIKADTKLRNDVAKCIMEKLEPCEQPEKEAEKPEEVSEEDMVRYKCLIAQLTSAESKLDDLRSASAEIYMFDREIQHFMDSVERRIRNLRSPRYHQDEIVKEERQQRGC